MDTAILIGLAALLGIAFGIQVMGQRPPQITVVQMEREEREPGGCGGLLLLVVLIVLILSVISNTPGIPLS